jgi:hypothetical protein
MHLDRLNSQHVGFLPPVNILPSLHAHVSPSEVIPPNDSYGPGNQGLLLGRGQLKCDGTRAETRFCLSAKWTSPFKSAGASVQSTTGSRGVHISGSNAGYTKFRGIVKGTGYPLHSPVFPSLSPLCVTLCHNISTGVYLNTVCSHLDGGVRAGRKASTCTVQHIQSKNTKSEPIFPVSNQQTTNMP